MKKAMKRIPNICFSFIFFMIIIAVAGIEESFAVGETFREDYLLTQGVTESTVYVTVDGGYNVRTHILRISDDASVGFKVTYGGYYGKLKTEEYRKSNTTQWSDANWTFESVRDQARDYGNTPDAEGDVIAASNGDFFDVNNGEPEGSLVIEGKILKKNIKRPFFAVLNNGKMVIRPAGGRLSDATDAVSGKPILVWKGKIAVDHDEERKPREAIGICEDGTVVVLSVDGREPASAGITLYELAKIMKEQKCKSALNLDGGGSVSFMTKRAEDSELEFRSNHSDGPERNVGPSLLITTNQQDGSYHSGKLNTVSMKSKSTRLWKDANGVNRYEVNGTGQTGFFSINGEAYLFSKGKGVTSALKIGKTTYRFTKGKLANTTDKKAGRVIIGYCGASGKYGKNLVYAYHYGDKLLNFGINPRSGTANGIMKRWTHDTVLEIPWYSVRADIAEVYIGDGIVNLGDYFLYSTRGHMTGGANAPVCKLKKIRLPASVKTIGAYSLFNKPMLLGIVIPSKVKSIEKYALAYSGAGTIRFTGKTPPAFKRMAMKKTGVRTVYIRNSKAWKTFVKKNGFKLYGYKRAVKYR